MTAPNRAAQVVRLRPLRVEDEAAFHAAHAAMHPDGFTFGLGYEDGMEWHAYVGGLELIRTSTAVTDDLVPAVFLGAFVDGRLVGRSSIRFALNDYLAREGGHIGYGVLPAERRRGYATSILEQSIVIARATGVDRILVTRDDTNVGSMAVIERCGGEYESTVASSVGGPPKRRYWIA